jgi:hypothetical protein
MKGSTVDDEESNVLKARGNLEEKQKLGGFDVEGEKEIDDLELEQYWAMNRVEESEVVHCKGVRLPPSISCRLEPIER